MNGIDHHDFGPVGGSPKPPNRWAEATPAPRRRSRQASPAAASTTSYSPSPSLAHRVVLITGASRGIGRALALTCARAGARVVVAAKTAEPHSKLPGTIHSVAAEVRALGAEALPVQVDVRSEEQVAALFSVIERTFGQLDAVVVNAGAISLTPLSTTPAKRFDLLQQVNARAFFLCAQAALPLLRRSPAGHLVSLSPPISLDPKWLAPHAPYTLSKYGMTLLALGLAGELALARDRISVCCLWPRTTIATAAIEFAVGGPALLRRCRTPQIVADAILEILATTDGSWSGRALLDEEVLRACGVSDFSPYAVDPAHAADLQPDLFVDTAGAPLRAMDATPPAADRAPARPPAST